MRDKPLDPALLLEASRAMNQAGSRYESALKLVSEWALKNLSAAGPEVRAGILGDAAALRLSGRVPGGYQGALALLVDIDPPGAKDTNGRLHLLRALAMGQEYKALKSNAVTPAAETPKKQDDIKKKLLVEIRRNLEIAFKLDADMKNDNRSFWEPYDDDSERTKYSLRQRDTTAVKNEDDLVDVFLDDEEFRKLVGVGQVDVAGGKPSRDD